MTTYYIDACIWRDYLENRSDKFRPLGEWAFNLIKKIISNQDLIVYSDVLEQELFNNLLEKEVKEGLDFIPEEVFMKVKMSKSQFLSAKALSRELKVHISDVMHAVMARDNNAILITRDAHFTELRGMVTVKKPEDLI